MPTTSAPSSVTSTRRPGHPAAVLWDMDGTIVDSEPYWIATETELATENGGTWSHEQGLAMVGRPIADTAELLRDLGVPGTVAEISDELVRRVAGRIRTEGAPWRPGARELLTALGEAGIPCALVTMSYREMADAVLEVLPEGTFAAVVTGDEVTHSKPHPEPYLTAARMLGVDIRDCVAFEDSVPGVASAEASGAATVVVPMMIPIPPAPGRSMVHTLEGLTIEDLASVLAGTPLVRM
ncbi:HAD family phosphatase [Georgenia sp. 311]|uniref:HAD family phosphatase n=1 Tax=Georgenia wutianyii TaxID=2585135 RepID=A0ABX5VLR4_9MICO|nr:MULTISPECIES: HAD family phosphatase [Georgenia]QDB79143.1 HAD family phosphatase [Georgenia wutianyii]TNC19188.1 HAD family phosphatase [Georgenia sp. 311]